MADPTFLLIGAQKAGTTASIYSLNFHPDIYMHKDEIHFFDHNYHLGLDHYRSMFKTSKQIRGEKTPIYCYSKTALRRIHTHYPNIKLVMFLREPVSRAYSQWNMSKKWFSEIVNFQEYIQEDLKRLSCGPEDTSPSDNIRRGFYDEQLEFIYSLFPRENVYVGIYEWVRKQPLQEYNKIFQFLGTRPLTQEEFKFDTTIHKLPYSEPISPKMKEQLQNLYRPHNQRLYEILGSNIPEWD